MLKIITFLLYLVSSPAIAQQGVTMRGYIDCGQWVSARATQPAAAYYETELIGIINGMSMASGIDIWGWNGDKMSAEQAYLYIDTYCQKNPLGNIFAASVALANEKTNSTYEKISNALKQLRQRK